MEKVFEYKKQGDRTDSWICTEFDDNGKQITKYMVYENPEKENKVDLISILSKATLEEIAFLKQALK